MRDSLMRGGTAEWCPKCKLMVLPVRLGQKTAEYRWVCLICKSVTVSATVVESPQ